MPILHGNALGAGDHNCVARKQLQIFVIFFRSGSHYHNLVSQRPRVSAKSNGNQSNQYGRSHEGAPLRAESPGEPLTEVVGTQRNERGKPGQKIAPDNGGGGISPQDQGLEQNDPRTHQKERKSLLSAVPDPSRR